MNAYEWGKKHRSCIEALERRKEYPSQGEWYKACDCGGWLFWQLEKLPAKLYEEKLIEAVNVIVDRAVANYALNHPITKKWAEKWLNGEDKSEASANDMWTTVTLCTLHHNLGSWSMAAEASGWAADAAANIARANKWTKYSFKWLTENLKRKSIITEKTIVDTAIRAAWASWAAASSQAKGKGIEEQKLQAADIHLAIPEWPGKDD